jgi:hypothetical protein
MVGQYKSTGCFSNYEGTDMRALKLEYVWKRQIKRLRHAHITIETNPVLKTECTAKESTGVMLLCGFLIVSRGFGNVLFNANPAFTEKPKCDL